MNIKQFNFVITLSWILSPILLLIGAPIVIYYFLIKTVGEIIIDIIKHPELKEEED